MTSFPLISASGSHHELGRSYGAQAGETVRSAAGLYASFASMFGVTADVVALHAEPYRKIVGKYLPWVLEELEGLAEGSGVSLSDLLVVNARSELISRFGASMFECTSVAVTQNRSEDGRPRVAQNWDWLTLMKDLPIVLSAKPEGQPAYVTFCESGQLAKIGVNECGLAVGLNFLTTPEGQRDRVGIPIHLLLRVILAAESIHEALFSLLELPIGGGAHFLLADKSGAIASFEVSPAKTKTYEIGADSKTDGLLTHANSYELDLPPEAQRPCRSARLARLLDGRKPTRQTLFEVLRDHETGAPEVICSHPTAPMASSSIASFVLEPAGSEGDSSPAMWIARGAPCHGNAPTKYRPVENN